MNNGYDQKLNEVDEKNLLLFYIGLELPLLLRLGHHSPMYTKDDCLLAIATVREPKQYILSWLSVPT